MANGLISSADRMTSLVRKAGSGALDLLYPASCLICGGSLDFDVKEEGTFPRGTNDPSEPAPMRGANEKLLLCPTCRGVIQVDEAEQCPRCAGVRFYRRGDSNGCRNCRNKSFHFRKVIALGEYIEPLRGEILRIKTDHLSILTETLVHLLVIARQETLRKTGADCVIPVPTHFIRRTIRGVNSAERIGDEIARFLGVPCYKNLVYRNRWTVHQSTRIGPDRFKNVKDAFSLHRRRLLGKIVPLPSIAGKTVLLADDILTTGATASEVSRVLLEAGAKEVIPVVLARAEGN